MTNPYENLPDDRFWKTAVASRDPVEIAGLWRPKFPLSRNDGVATAGSCFAQHIGRALVERGYSWIDAEPAPNALTAASRKRFNYGLFSFRTGNIYTAAQLRQWMSWALGKKRCPGEVWQANGRFYDPFRPVIEPDGFSSMDELLDSREHTLASIRTAVRRAAVFVFTMGLTEGWEHRRHGYAYAMCPGTAAGEFDPQQHVPRNYAYPEIRADMEAALALMRRFNRNLKVLLTVSPVPLTATASAAHVLTATTYSKSALRAVAGDLAAAHDFVDYFPSYEIITGFPFRGMFFGPNLRSVSAAGVDFVMTCFFRDLAERFPECAAGAKSRDAGANGRTDRQARIAGDPAASDDAEDEVVCEDELLEAFSDRNKTP